MWFVAVGFAAAVLMTGTCLSTSMRRLSRARFAALLDEHDISLPVAEQIELREQLSEVGAIIRTAGVIFTTLLLLDFCRNRVRLLWPDTHTTTQIYLMAFLASWLFVLVFGVGLGNAVSRHRGERVVLTLLPLILVLRRVFSPFLYLLRLGDGLVRRLSGVSAKSAGSELHKLEQEILDAVTEGEVHGAVDEEEKDMIESVIELRETVVEQIMTPRTDIVALEAAATLDEIRGVFAEEGHSRVPVFEETVDHIVGVLYAKDLLARTAESPFQLKDLMRDAFFIPESKPVKELLRDFRRNKKHIAIVLDEYGGTAGLVTIEDILEEVMGDIGDEHVGEVSIAIRRLDEHSAEVDARTPIHEVNESLQLQLPESDDYETLGGFLFAAMGTVPQVGARYAHENVAFQVLDADPRSIKRLLVRVTPTSVASI